MNEISRKNSSYTFEPQCVPGFVLHVIERLNRAGFSAYIVGGALRDAMLARPVADWDIATSASNNEIVSIFADLRHFSLKHQTVTLVHKGAHYELTTIRGGVPSSNPIEEDLGHRDFTINAVAYDPFRQVIIDPYGGRMDLKRGIIRGVKEPSERFGEDPLRLIRAVRIAVELGFNIDRDTMKVISGMAYQLRLAAGERIREELLKILMVKRPSSGFRLLKKSRLLEAFLPELLEGLYKRQNRHHSYTVFRHIMETLDRVEQDPVLRLAALFHDIAKPRVRQKLNGEFHFYRHAEESSILASEIMERLRFSNKMIRKVTNIITNHMIEYDHKWSDGAIRRLVRRFNPDPIGLLLSFRKADLHAHGVAGEESGLLSELEERIMALERNSGVPTYHDLALNGQMVMDILGITTGPDVGKALEFLLEKVTDQPELNTVDTLTDMLKERGV